MRFRRIHLKNLFSYRDTRIDLEGAVPGRNIALISGRNGYGKTSFINAVKLLFVGPNKDMCSAVQQGSELRPKQYVLGVGEDWMGIFNRVARAAGERDARVAITWDEPIGEVEAVRSWQIEGDGYQERLQVDLRGDASRHLEGDEAQRFLNERLPEDYIPFFFFDGEQLQHLSEANRTRSSRHIERLLNISHVETLIDQLAQVSKGWRKEAMPGAARAELAKLEKDQAHIEAMLLAADETIEALATERRDLERLVREEDAYLERRRVANLAQNEAHLSGERKRLTEQLEHEQSWLADTLPLVAPLLVNPGLVRQTMDELKKLLESEAGVQADALREVLASLPQDLFDKPPFPQPRLTEGQARFYKGRLDLLLRAFIPAPEDLGNGLFHLDRSEAHELRTLLGHFALSDEERRGQGERLKSISRSKRSLAEVEDRLENLSNLPADEQDEYRRRKAENDERRQRIGAIDVESRQAVKQRDDQRGALEAKEKEIRSQEKQVTLSAQAERRLRLAQETRDLFIAYKEELKRRKRGAVENAVNRRFKELMTSHGLIDRIQVDDHFGIHYLDRDGTPIAMGSLSAGMKQLAATALLWALKEVSGKEVPLIVDTPLARIDREHQDNLLRRYYPQVAEQVIVLPTDAEIDREKYALIEPHLYREYRLNNPTGVDTRLEEAPMYGALGTVANG
ncbi:DNA sulfur modification protein DndD [Thiocystis violacea]|uniref:DNA sulfur modification protein DndD n=1 Tax=Thiocystis violacea TaxID=13725 RepID=UPI0019081DFF